ncbi:MAG: hypothetical protein M3348_07400 [Acidobacteriota bacterium]|nr:hypothetical protein [Acidobacteriota bacterium]
MKIERWKRIAFAACLTASAAFVCHAAAATRVRAVAVSSPCVNRRPVIRGEGLLRVGGYALNVRFTPEGRLLGFDISAAPQGSRTILP